MELDKIQIVDQIRRTLRWSVLDGIWWAVMVGAGESYLGAYGEFLNANGLQMALITAFPQLWASLSHLGAVQLSVKLKSRRMLITAFALLQGSVWLGMALNAFYYQSILLLVMLASLHYLFGAMGAAAWSSLMGDLVPQKKRGTYFGERNRLVGLCTTLTMIITGSLLSSAEDAHITTLFGTLFLIAFLGRMISSFYLSRHYEPQLEFNPPGKVGFLSFLKQLNKSHEGQFTFYNLWFLLAVYIASPLFILLWFRMLHFSYIQFMVLTSMSAVASFMTIAVWGRQTDEHGNVAIIKSSGYIITLIPLFWVVVPLLHENLWFSLGILIQLMSGFAWAGMNLATSNYLYDVLEPESRLRIIAYFSSIKGLAIFIGAMIGGLIADQVQMITIPIILSFFLRFIVHAILSRRLTESRKEVAVVSLFRIISIVPFHGLVLEPVIGMNRTVRQLRDKFREIWS